ncbi:MAG: phosphotransferase [Oscillospiraceae bacterium]|nr:phosphotransferase [Oscillospiraceae bacterium]
MPRFEFVSRTDVEKGWSGDKKYCAMTADGTKYLLRISPAEQYDRKKSEYEMMLRVAELDVPMCRALEFGTCDEGVYSVQTWIDGSDAEEMLPNLSEEKQYKYGFESGEILKKIHSIPAPEGAEDWEIYFNRKADRKIKMYEECPLKYENGHKFVEYINAHRHLLKNRPRTYQHGDYHVGNMMIDKSGKLFIIDFNRNDFGDPWEEFNRIVWCAQAAPSFAAGMVDGYFDGEVPMAFWELLALYISSNTLSSLPWAIPFGDGEIETMTSQAADVLAWYDNMSNPIPTWYKGGRI